MEPDGTTPAGGSLIIEAQDLRAGTVQARWAGARTAAGAADCGRTARLVMRDSDALTLAAGARR